MRFRFLTRVAFYYIWRSRKSTAVLGLMVFSAVAALIFLSSLAVGTNDAMIGNSVGLFSGHISGRDLPRDFSVNRLFVTGVAGVLPRLTQNAWLSRKEYLEPVQLYGIEPKLERKLTALWKKTIIGKFPVPGEASIYLSDVMAARLRVTVGDLVSLGARPDAPAASFKVCGIYHTGLSALDQNVAFCPKNAFPETGGSLEIAVFLNEGVDPQSVLDIYRSWPGPGRFAAWSDFMPDLKQLIDLNYVSMGIVMILVFGIVSLGISCAFIIFNLKNLREHGVMKAMGVSPGETAYLMLAQACLVAVAASLSGLIFGALGSMVVARFGLDLTAFTSHNQYFVVSGIIYPRLTLYSTALPAVLAVVFGLAAAVWPSVMVIRRNAADILRSI